MSTHCAAETTATSVVAPSTKPGNRCIGKNLDNFNPTYRSLDHWRGIAALGVTIFHAFGSFAPEESKLAPVTHCFFRASTLGAVGVHCFFVISGYCIAAYLWRNATQVTWKSFLADRFLRIYPTYWAACCVSIAVNYASSSFTGKSNGPPSTPTDLIANLLLIEPYTQTNPLLLVSWTLVFEIGFYIISAVALALRQTGTPQWMLFSLAFLLSIISTLTTPSGLFHVLRCWPEFFFGLSLFFALSNWNLQRKRSVFALCLIPLLVVSNYVGQTEPDRLNAVLLSAVFSLGLFALHRWDYRLSTVKQIQWLASIGTFSYSLYLTHTFLGLKFVSISRRAVPVESELVILVAILATIASVLSGYAFYFLFEKRFENIRKRLTRKPQRNVLAHHGGTA